MTPTPPHHPVAPPSSSPGGTPRGRYTFGAAIALSAFLYGHVTRADDAPPPKGFFEGYSLLGVCLMLSQALQVRYPLQPLPHRP